MYGPAPPPPKVWYVTMYVAMHLLLDRKRNTAAAAAVGHLEEK